MDLSGRIAQANGRLKSASVGVQIQQLNDRLYLRATLPPRPGSSKSDPYQQRIATGIHANPAGLKEAEGEARLVGALLDRGEFDWGPYLRSPGAPPQNCGDWVEKFEADYFTRRRRNPQSETTWKSDYLKVFSQLPSDQALTPELLKEAIAGTAPDTRTRRRFVQTLSRLATFAGIETDLKPLIGNYSPSKVSPRDVPADRLVAEVREALKDGPWKWAYGMLAVYGLRNHELFSLDVSRFPVIQVVDGTKTGARRIWPIYPEWAEQWQLNQVSVPNCTGKTNSDLGNRVTHAFKRLKIPFNPYDLRHAWAIRSITFGLPTELAAAQMGHSLQVHNSIYHAWITDEVHQRHFEILMQRSDRPQPPEV